LSSKKILPQYCTVIRVICSYLKIGHGYTTKEIRSFTGLEKQKLNYWLKKMCVDGLLIQPNYGIYEMTISGKRIFDQYERLQNKQMIRIENMHVTYKVIRGISKLFDRFNWKRAGLKNNKVYTSKIRNHTVRLIKTENGYNFQVYVTKVLGESTKEAYHQARIEADHVAGEAQRFGAHLSLGWVTNEPEIAIPSPMASALLMTYEASQIRTNKGIINRSKGRFADWEPRNLQQAQKIVDMPDSIERIEAKLDRIEGLLRLNTGSLYHDLSNPYWRFL